MISVLANGRFSRRANRRSTHASRLVRGACDTWLPPELARCLVLRYRVVSMKEISNNNFGLLIAFFIPGFVALFGLGYMSESIRTWLAAQPAHQPTVAGFLYVTLASCVAGLTVSTVRWAVIDTIHFRTGIAKPRWDFSRLRSQVDLYHLLNENHYRFYQHYSNMIIALLFFVVARRIGSQLWSPMPDIVEVASLALSVIYFLGSRDTFRKFHSRLDHLLANDESVDATKSALEDQPIARITYGMCCNPKSNRKETKSNLESRQLDSN